MTFLILAVCIISLVLLITWAKVNPFLAFLIVSIAAGLLLGMPLVTIGKSVSKGIGDTLGSILIVIVLGGMLGKLVAESGAAQRIAADLRKLFGDKYMVWAMTLTGFIVGIPLYYNVGFVLLVPIIFSVAYNFKLPVVYVGLPMLASLSVMHGFLPPHPSPMALLVQFKADMGMTFFYGIIIAIPTIIVAGPLFAKTLKKIKSDSSTVFTFHEVANDKLPGTANSFLSALLPVILIAITTIIEKTSAEGSQLKNIALFFGDANLVMLLTIIIATYTLGMQMGKRLKEVMNLYTEAVKDISMILLIIGSAGILKQIFIDSGASNEIASALEGWNMPPLLLAWVDTFRSWSIMETIVSVMGLIGVLVIDALI